MSLIAYACMSVKTATGIMYLYTIINQSMIRAICIECVVIVVVIVVLHTRGDIGVVLCIRNRC